MSSQDADLILYEHTQQAWWMLTMLLVGLVAQLVSITRAARREGSRFWPSVIAVAGFALGAAASSLTVVVRRGEVEAAFAGGLFRHRVDLATVESTAVVHVPWYYGRGARLKPGGRLYSVWGTEAVELTLADGRTFTIGSDEPYLLLGAVDQARRSVTG